MLLLADFNPPSINSKKNHVVLIVGISAAVLFLGLVVLGILRRKGCLGGKVSADKGI